MNLLGRLVRRKVDRYLLARDADDNEELGHDGLRIGRACFSERGGLDLLKRSSSQYDIVSVCCFQNF